jgi:hypothetical protein
MTYLMKHCVSFKHFDSLTEMVDFADAAVAGGSRLNRSVLAIDDPEFLGDARTYKDASRLVREGWARGVEDMSHAMTQIRDGLDGIVVRQAEMDIVGPICMVGDYLAGDPECMLNPAATDEKPVINFLIDTGARARAKPKEMVLRGAAICALLKAVEDSGRQVSIYASSIASCEGGWQAHIVCIKRAGEDFNLHTLSYALAHPSYHRRHGFAVRAGMGNNVGGSGSIVDMEGIEHTIGDVDIYFPCITDVPSSHFRTEASATEYVLGIGRKCGLISE